MKPFSVISIIILFLLLLTGCPGIMDMFNSDDTLEKSTDATLSGLIVTTGSVDNVYIPVENSCEIMVVSTIDSVTFSPVFSNTKASLAINGSSYTAADTTITKPLLTGTNTFTLTVTAEDGVTSRIYAVTVIRQITTAADILPPVIILTGDNPLYLEANSAYTEPGFTAWDFEEGDLSNAVTVAGEVDNTTSGTYNLRYNVSDTSGNNAVEVIREIIVWDSTEGDSLSPVITLNGNNPIYIILNGTFTDPGAVIKDNVDVDSTITGEGAIDESTAGSYTLRYNAVDAAGNNAEEITRIVVVIESLAPPSINLPLGSYDSSQTVTITHPIPDVRILYTLNNIWNTSGNEWLADENVGTEYSGEITISEPTTLIARAFLEGIESVPFSRAEYAIVSPGDTNLIANGDFTYGLNLWGFWAGGTTGSEAEFSVENGVYKTAISAGGDNDWNVNSFYRLRFPLEQNEYYQLQFTAWAESNRQINIQLHEEGIDNNDDGNAYTNYFSRDVPLTSSPQVFTYTMSMNDEDNPLASLRFNLGIETADVYIDDISLENITHSIYFLTETDVPDPELRNFLENETGKPFGEITDTDMTALEALYLDGNDYSVTELTGIEYCTELNWFLMETVNIPDFTILSELSDLKDLGITNSSISNFLQISSLTNLETLYLDGNNISDISSISGMTSLRFIALGENPLDIEDLAVITPANFPNLQRLHLDNGWDPAPINLDTDLNDLLTILEDLDNLIDLSMDDFFSMNDSQFASLYTRVLEPRKLEWDELCFTDSYLQDPSLALLANLTELRKLDLFANNITDLTDIEPLTKLINLGLGENEFTTLTPLQDLYTAGGFQADGTGDSIEVDIRDCFLDISPESNNEVIVDYLITHGVDVDYEEGNLTSENIQIAGTSYYWQEEEYLRNETTYHDWTLYTASGNLYMSGKIEEFDNSSYTAIYGFYENENYMYQKGRWSSLNPNGYYLQTYGVYSDIDAAKEDTAGSDLWVYYTNPAIIPPVLILQGDNPMTIIRGTSFAMLDPGAMVKDWGVPDETIGASLLNGLDDSSVPGTYVVTYTKTDSNLNQAIPVTRTVEVVEVP